MTRFTSKDDFLGFPHGIEQYQPGSPHARDLALGISSGTSGGMLSLIVYNQRHTTKEKSFLCKLNTRHKHDRVLRLSLNPQNTFRLTTEVLTKTKTKQFLTATKRDVDNPYFQHIVSEFRPTQIYATPSSMVVHMLASLHTHHATHVLSHLNKDVSCLVLSGERMTPTQKGVIRRFLPNATLYDHYTLSETPWWSAHTCPLHPDPDTSVHCVAPHFTEAVTIYKPDAEEVGEIVVSTKELGHYRTGDMGKVEKQECDCGSRKKLTVYGRFNYDIVPCVGATFLISEVDRVFGEIDVYVDDFLLEVAEEVGADNVVRGKVRASIVPTDALRTEGAPAVTVRDAFETRLFVTPTRTLRDLIEENIFLPSEITFTDEIPRRNKKIRLRRV